VPGAPGGRSWVRTDLDPADGLTYVLCTIPSYSYLQETAITSIDSSNTVVIEVSNNGENFSASGKTFKFLAIDQLLGAYPVFGPDSGGTTVSVEMVDLPESSLLRRVLRVPWLFAYFHFPHL